MPMIAVCDILGFTKLVKNSPIDHVVTAHLGYLRKALYHSIYQKNFPSEPPSLEELKKQGRVGVTWFSDTILFYGLDDSPESSMNVIETVGWLLFETMPKSEVRIRAGVSFGEAHIDAQNDIYVGSGIIEAYQLEQIQEWSGGALADSAIEHVNRNSPWLVSYDVPVKLMSGQRTFFRTLAINWTSGFHYRGRFDLYWLPSREEALLEELIMGGEIVEKWRNTKSFHEKVCQICR
jgi:hypothetical protein